MRQILDFCRRAENALKQECDSDTDSSSCTWNGPQRLGRWTGEIEDQRKKQDHLDHSIVKSR